MLLLSYIIKYLNALHLAPANSAPIAKINTTVKLPVDAQLAGVTSDSSYCL